MRHREIPVHLQGGLECLLRLCELPLAQVHLTDTGTPLFTRVAPAAGAGIRLRMNKLSRTNLSIDYGMGIEGSHGLFFNLGEVF